MADPLLLRYRRRRTGRTAVAAGGNGNGHSASGNRRDGVGVERALGLKQEVDTYLGEIDAREINSIPIGTGSDGTAIVARVGRYGPYLQRGEDRVSIPDDLAPDELTVERAESLLDGTLVGPGARQRPRHRPAGAGQGRTVRSLRPARRADRRTARSRGPRRCSPRCRRRPSPSSRRSSCSPSRGWSGPTPRTARRSSPTTAASVPT